MKLHPVIFDALMRNDIDADEFFGRNLIPQAVIARSEAIQELAAAGLNNRAIAKMVKRNICTVRYWRSPNIREYRRVYKAGTRAQGEQRDGYLTAEEAHRAYCDAASKYFGDYARFE